ncbi:hypothetical protein FHS78_002008 [Parvibaculum indicum]|uniref:putative signal transducing protein n=1 Tax=Parvibaculum indicum TaxID=562969 RepID=UPI001422FF5D|nr:DUF2007 domain-containing protein [Parvibaculum indicum]NIJ41718.1 hypothetical protein [Parvibaculum indicum]
MKELLRSNDPVLVSYLEHRLREAGVEPLVLDAYTSIVEGSLGILPRRMMVAEEDHPAAARILDEVQRESEAGPGERERGDKGPEKQGDDE